jgi:hypothetical protein
MKWSRCTLQTSKTGRIHSVTLDFSGGHIQDSLRLFLSSDKLQLCFGSTFGNRRSDYAKVSARINNFNVHMRAYLTGAPRNDFSRAW